MSRLRIFQADRQEVCRFNVYYEPEESEAENRSTFNFEPHQIEQAVISYAERAARIRRERLTDTAERARLIRANMVCPRCGRVTVEVRELLAVGTSSSHSDATEDQLEPQLGFYCFRCHKEWTA